MGRGSLRAAMALMVVLTAVSAAPALAHVERPAYFPDPAADTSVTPAAGGALPKVRSLASALDKSRPGDTRIVCRPNSLKLLRADVKRAVRKGYDLRPSDHRRLTAKQGRRLVRTNRKLFKRCRYKEIQPAVTASRNNDRVVVMPGLYTEPTARKAPTHDPSCQQFRVDGDRPGDKGAALSYEYQFRCPNDQNLIAVIGRELGSGTDPRPPLENRFGVPNAGACIRCNLQLEGSGVGPDDVVVDAGDTAAGNGGPNGAGHAKDVVIRADRADGFVLRNVTVRHAGENGLYVIETDGYRLERFKTFYSVLYGTLVFTSDHGVQGDCEAAGHGDSGVYPGGAPDTGWQRPDGTTFRYNQLVRRCDLHHNMAGYSGTSGNAVHVTDNNLYDNALGFTTDTVTGAGHPGYPGDSILLEKNRIYSNNFDLYGPASDVKPAFPFPVGTGMWIAGGNHHTVRDNYFYDNWRRGTMLFSVPDALVCGPVNDGNQQAGCNELSMSTSHYNAFYDNKMGLTPDGKEMRNGIDFWWDDFPASRGNCWFKNVSPTHITSSPANLPNCAGGQDPGQSVGTGDPQNEGELVSCVAAFESRDFGEDSTCPWLVAPSKPGSGRRASVVNREIFEPFVPVPPAQAPGTVPLGQANCNDWRAASADAQAALVVRVEAFIGGVVNTGQRDLGTGHLLEPGDASRLFDGWCSHAYATNFLLYKLYAAASAMS